MKLKKTIALSLSSLVLLSGAGTALAARTEGPDTKGTIDFKTATDPAGEIIKPETDEKIEVEEGGFTKGLLRLQHVPDFNFGIQEIASGEHKYTPTLTKYKLTGTEEAKYIPHFVQVTDERGLNEGFKLTVSATKFKRQLTGHELPAASITLKDGKLSNTTFTDEQIKGKIKTFKGDENTGELTIPFDPENAGLVMETKDNTAASTTNGTQTSLVFNKDYTGVKDYTGTEKNPGVVFTKTNLDLPTAMPAEGATADPYVSTITWTLTAGV